LQIALEVDGQNNGQGNERYNYHVEYDVPLKRQVLYSIRAAFPQNVLISAKIYRKKLLFKISKSSERFLS